jgi:hypothetical protein
MSELGACRTPNRRVFQHLPVGWGWAVSGFLQWRSHFPRYSPRYFCVIFLPLRVLVAIAS